MTHSYHFDRKCELASFVAQRFVTVGHHLDHLWIEELGNG